MQVHGITTETVHRFLVDAGAVYVNLGEPDERLLGATRGGNAFVVEQDVREIPIDGAKGPVKGARRVIEVRARITANLIEMTAENFRLALAGADRANYPPLPAPKTHDEITRSREVAADDYLTNVALVGRIAGQGQPFIGIIHNALADANLEITTSDRDEAGLQVRFTAHFDPAELEREPWAIRFPVEE